MITNGRQEIRYACAILNHESYAGVFTSACTRVKRRGRAGTPDAVVVPVDHVHLSVISAGDSRWPVEHGIPAAMRVHEHEEITIVSP